MRLANLAYILLCCVTSTGCDVSRLVVRRVVVDQIHYNAPVNSLFSDIRNQKLAKAAWHDVTAEMGSEFSQDYERGFKAGFVDFLMGGTGKPPVLPPRRYWKVHYQTPEGRGATEEWFEGFRTGAMVAESKGMRQWIVIPTSLSDPGSSPPIPDTVPASWLNVAYQAAPVPAARQPLKPGPGPRAGRTPEVRWRTADVVQASWRRGDNKGTDPEWVASQSKPELPLNH